MQETGNTKQPKGSDTQAAQQYIDYLLNQIDINEVTDLTDERQDLQ